MLTVALIIISIVIFVSYIWLLVVGFKQHVLWGIGMFFIPLVSIIFVIMYWQKAKTPFLIYLISSILMVAIIFEPMSKVMSESIQIAERVKNGEITEQQGQELMRQRMMQLLSGSDTVEITDDDLLTPEEQRIESLREDLRIKNDAARASQAYAQEQAKKVEIKAEQLRKVNVFTPIKISQLKNNIGKKLRIVSFEGVERQGILLSAGFDRLSLKRSLAGGEFNFDVLTKDIKTVEVQQTVLK